MVLRTTDDMCDTMFTTTEYNMKGRMIAMSNYSKAPSVSEIEQRIAEGMSYGEIARKYDVHESTIWRKLQRAGRVGGKPTSDEYLPWVVEPEHRRTGIYYSLVTLQRMKEGREVLDERKSAALNMVKGLKRNGLVVAYDPRVGPNPATRLGGFYYAKKQDGDYDYMQNPKED